MKQFVLAVIFVALFFVIGVYLSTGINLIALIVK